MSLKSLKTYALALGLSFIFGAAAAAAATIVPAQAAADTPVHSYGIVRVSAGGVWQILDDAAHTPQGLTGVTCNGGGDLVVAMDPVAEVGVASTSPDETYAGRFEFGPSIGLDRIVVRVTDHDGTRVHCSSTSLRLANSNILVDFWGRR